MCTADYCFFVENKKAVRIMKIRRLQPNKLLRIVVNSIRLEYLTNVWREQDKVEL